MAYVELDVMRFFHRHAKLVSRISLTLLAVLILALVSPLCPGSSTISYTDSSVFQYIGSSLLDGYIPYRDIFDHKGPLIYLINALGWLIHGESGIWLIEVLLLIGCVNLWFESSYMLNQSAVFSFFTSFLGLAAFSLWIEGGNLTEEYCLPCLSTILYLYARCFTGGYVSMGQAVVIGLSCSSIFLIKFNALVLAAPMIMFELAQLHKQGQGLGRYITAGLMGFTLPVLIIALWLAVTNAFDDFIADYFAFNLTYAGGADLIDRIASLTTMFNSCVIVISFALLFIAVFSGSILSRDITFSVLGILVSFAIGFVVIAGTGFTYAHYLLFFIPPMIFAVSLIPVLLATFGHPVRSLVCSISVVVLLAFFVAPAFQSSVSYAKSGADSKDDQMVLVNEVSSRTDPGDMIGVVGNVCWIYLKSDTIAASQLAYLPVGIEDPAPWLDAMYEDFHYSDAKLVLVASQSESTFCNESFLAEYRCVSDAYGFKVYERRCEQ